MRNWTLLLLNGLAAAVCWYVLSTIELSGIEWVPLYVAAVINSAFAIVWVYCLVEVE